MEVKPKNYLAIQGWMRTELDLSGSELLLYAIIYGFSQEENQWCVCGLKYFCDWLGLSGKQRVREVIQRLLDKELIIKRDETINGVKFCKYKAISHPVAETDTPPVAEKATNNYNIDNNINPLLPKGNVPQRGERKHFSPPSVDEVKAYCLEKGYSVDAQHFVDFYESKGWVVGKSPMKDWHAAIRTWIRNEKIYQPTTTTQYAANNRRSDEPVAAPRKRDYNFSF